MRTDSLGFPAGPKPCLEHRPGITFLNRSSKRKEEHTEPCVDSSTWMTMKGESKRLGFLSFSSPCCFWNNTEIQVFYIESLILQRWISYQISASWKIFLPWSWWTPSKFSVAWISWQGNMDITVFTWGNDREPSAPASVEFSAEWVHSWMTSCQENLEDQDCQSLTSCWFLTSGTSLGLILLSLILVQIRGCINCYREVLFILPEPSLSVQGLTASVFEAWRVSSSYLC